MKIEKTYYIKQSSSKTSKTQRLCEQRSHTKTCFDMFFATCPTLVSRQSSLIEDEPRGSRRAPLVLPLIHERAVYNRNYNAHKVFAGHNFEKERVTPLAHIDHLHVICFQFFILYKLPYIVSTCLFELSFMLSTLLRSDPYGKDVLYTSFQKIQISYCILGSLEQFSFIESKWRCVTFANKQDICKRLRSSVQDVVNGSDPLL